MKGTIKDKEVVEYIFSHGKRIVTKGIIVIYSTKSERDQKGRVAFIAGKKIGCAPKRSYAKRVMRHIVREIDGFWKYDAVLIARKPIFDLDFEDIRKELVNSISKAGLVVPE